MHFYLVCQNLNMETSMESSYRDGTDIDKIVSVSAEVL